MSTTKPATGYPLPNAPKCLFAVIGEDGLWATFDTEEKATRYPGPRMMELAPRWLVEYVRVGPVESSNAANAAATEICDYCGIDSADAERVAAIITRCFLSPVAQTAESEELAMLRREWNLSWMGDRPQSMAVDKLRRLIELEAAPVRATSTPADFEQLAALRAAERMSTLIMPNSIKPDTRILTPDEVAKLEARLERFLSGLTFGEPARGNRYVESVDGSYYFEENADNEFDAFDLLRLFPTLCQTVRAAWASEAQLAKELVESHSRAPVAATVDDEATAITAPVSTGEPPADNTLTDAEVDAWLEAHKDDPVDLAQANRIEWLFRKKLAASVIDKAKEWLRYYDERIAAGGKGAQDMERLYGEEAAFHRDVIRAIETLALEPSTAATSTTPVDGEQVATLAPAVTPNVPADTDDTNYSVGTCPTCKQPALKADHWKESAVTYSAVTEAGEQEGEL